MITKDQIEALAIKFQIDTGSILREYIQLTVLNILYQYSPSAHIIFKGGTAVHFIFGSSRFSVDLDFSTSLSDAQIKSIVLQMKKDSAKEADISIDFLHRGQDTTRYKIRYSHPQSKYPISIRLDFNKELVLCPYETTVLASDFPIAFIPAVVHMSAKEIVAEKIHALFSRAKGRDIYDLWFLLNKNIPLDIPLISAKLRVNHIHFSKTALQKRIADFPQKSLETDLRPFLPLSQRKLLPQLKLLLTKQFEEKLSKKI